MSTSEDKIKVTSIRITAEREIARRTELSKIYSALVDEANLLMSLAERIRPLINDSELFGKDATMPVDLKAQKLKRKAKAIIALAHDVVNGLDE